jgi:hypothetical protein
VTGDAVLGGQDRGLLTRVLAARLGRGGGWLPRRAAAAEVMRTTHAQPLTAVGSALRPVGRHTSTCLAVGAPAVLWLRSRVRFCLSAAHTTEMLEEALVKIGEVADMTMIKYDTSQVTNLVLE